MVVDCRNWLQLRAVNATGFHLTQQFSKIIRKMGTTSLAVTCNRKRGHVFKLKEGD